MNPPASKLLGHDRHDDTMALRRIIKFARALDGYVNRVVASDPWDSRLPGLTRSLEDAQALLAYALASTVPGSR